MGKTKTIKVPLTFNDVKLNEIAKWDEKQYNDVHLVHMFSGMEKDELRKLPQTAIEQTGEHLRKILASPTQEHVERLKIGGKEYGFIKDWSELSGGEYVDTLSYLDEPLKNCSKLMAVWFRPIVDEWDGGYAIEEYKGTKHHGVFSEVSASHFYGALGFFLTIMTSSVITSLQFLEEEVRDSLMKTEKTKKRTLIGRLLGKRFKPSLDGTITL